MKARGTNRVRELRVARGLSQKALAAAASITRQSLFAIESGRSQPAVDVAVRIARALGSDVETAFGAGTESTRITTLAAGPISGRVAVANIGGRWVSHALMRQASSQSADALFVRKRAGHAEVELLRSSAECRNNVILMGCAPALGLLANRLNAQPGPGRFTWLLGGSTEALDALRGGRINVAGVHLVDGKTGEANVPDVRRRLRNTSAVLVTLARWEAGILVAAGNPKGLRSAASFENRALRGVVREEGSGARRLLERELHAAGIPLRPLLGRATFARGHLETAQAISMGAADFGIATRDAALAYGLDFVPITDERYDLVVAPGDLADPRLVRMFDVLTAWPLRREFAALGYDLSCSGERVAEIRAA